MPKSPPGSRGRREPAVPYSVRVSLVGVEPEVWRRVAVPSSITLEKLNHVIQGAMGWMNSHLHEFEVGGMVYTDPEFELDVEHEDEAKVRLQDLVRRLPTVLLYQYDFGDSWSHVVLVEGHWLGEEEVSDLPRCVGGAEACPPEDVGGVPGYQHFLEAVQDPEHEEYESMRTWVGEEFDPRAFDLKEADGRLKAVRRRSRIKAVRR